MHLGGALRNEISMHEHIYRISCGLVTTPKSPKRSRSNSLVDGRLQNGRIHELSIALSTTNRCRPDPLAQQRQVSTSHTSSGAHPASSFLPCGMLLSHLSVFPGHSSSRVQRHHLVDLPLHIVTTTNTWPAQGGRGMDGAQG